MTKIDELKQLLNQMENITCEEEYFKEVGLRSQLDFAIVTELINLRKVLEGGKIK